MQVGLDREENACNEGEAAGNGTNERQGEELQIFLIR
jgi:hypothetical protein